MYCPVQLLYCLVQLLYCLVQLLYCLEQVFLYCSEPDAKKLRETAQAFGYGNQNPGEQIRVSAATEGFRYTQGRLTILPPPPKVVNEYTILKHWFRVVSFDPDQQKNCCPLTRTRSS